MKRVLLTVVAGLSILLPALADTIKSTPGAPYIVINMTDWNNGVLTFNRLGYISGDGTSFGLGPERWTAIRIHVPNPITFDRIVVDTFLAAGDPNNGVGWKFYADNNGVLDFNTIVAQGTQSGDPFAGTFTYANGYFVDEQLYINTGTPVTLPAGTYWFTVYGIPTYAIAWFTGAPRTSFDDKAYNYRRRGSAPNDWSQYTAVLNAFRMPPHGLNGTNGIFTNPNTWDYGGIGNSGQPGAISPNAIFHCGFFLVKTGETGGTISGTLALNGYSRTPDQMAPYDIADVPMDYVALLLKPGTNEVISRFDFRVDASGNFTFPMADPGSELPIPGDIPAGTYDVVIRDAAFTEISWDLDGDGQFDDWLSPATSHFVGKRFNGVVVPAGGNVNLGSFTLANGDADRDGAAADSDLGAILLAFGSLANEDPSAGAKYRYALDLDNVGTFDELIIADSDLGIILLNFGQSQPEW